MEEAPFHRDLAEGPPSESFYLQTDDATRIRVTHWPGEGRGTVFVFPGRCEYTEKYGRTAGDLTSRGFDVLAVDWRGQGLADRLLRDPSIGHVRRFSDYQIDARAMMAFAEMRGLPRPWHMLAHSMGGCIGLRTLSQTDNFSAAAFSAPMWGLQISQPLRHAATTLPILARGIGLGGKRTPTTGDANFFLDMPYEGNFLTTDREQWDYMARQAQEVQSFRLGGPSLVWLAEALKETRALPKLPRPTLPVHASVGTEEKIVDPEAIRRQIGAWDGASLEMVQGAEHEILMEAPERRLPFIERIVATFEEARD